MDINNPEQILKQLVADNEKLRDQLTELASAAIREDLDRRRDELA